MKSRIVRIGNSRGIRIPKPLLEETGMSEDVVIEISGNTLVIRPAGSPRAGWEAAFRSMADVGDDQMLDGSVETSNWDSEDWEW